MSSPFGARRKARAIRQHEDSDEDKMEIDSLGTGVRSHENTPTVRRPAVKKRSSLRLSFGPGSTSMTEDGTSSEVFTPKKSNLSRQAIEKNALRKSLAASGRLPVRQNDDSRPSYSADYLNELKSSTPSTPKVISSAGEEPTGIKTLDIASKFGTSLALHNYQQENPLIPTSAEIAERKERRARLAKEQEFISLNPSGSDGENTSNPSDDNLSDHDPTISVHHHARPSKRSRHPESRLVHDDEDIAEGFDSFVQDGRIALSKKTQREQRSRQKDEIRALIDEAEGSGSAASSETDDSEAERRAEYEAAQTRKAMDGLQHTSTSARDDRPRTPPKITPLPNLANCLLRLRARLKGLEQAQGLRRKEMEGVEREKKDILVREGEIQRLLGEAGERYERLRKEAEGVGVGIEGGGSKGENVNGGTRQVTTTVQPASGNDNDSGSGISSDADADADTDGDTNAAHHLDHQQYHTTTIQAKGEDEVKDEIEDEEEEADSPGRPGLGSGLGFGGGGGGRSGLGWS
ncbi:hypothetical protein MMC14_007036 [Varicellaria rhodocarpa]|nr:hypothetical protein [Varicellaria rhodocarpa]